MDDLGSRLQVRPYYDPESFNAGYTAVFKPDQGVVDSNGQSIASKLNIVQSSGKNLAKRIGKGTGSSGSLLSGLSINDGKRLLSKVSAGDNGDSPKSIADMEWLDFLNLKAWKRILGQLLDQFFRKYFRHLVQQPFEVARCLLQVGDFSQLEVQEIPAPVELRDEEDDDENEEIDFFPRANDQELSPSLEDDEMEKSLIKEAGKPGAPIASEVLIHPQSKHTIDIMNSVMDSEGMRGLWKANNTTFIYNFLSLTLDAWFTGLISPFMGIPDPYFMDIIHSPDVKSSIVLTLTASTLTKIVLLPLDIIRTRFIVTSLKKGSKPIRSLRQLVRSWSWRADIRRLPADMWILTMLQSISSVTFNKIFDVVIYRQWNIEKHSQVKWYNTLKLLSQTVELLVRLPLENLLRRCQVNFLTNDSRHPLKIERTDLIVKPIGYHGVWNSLRDPRTSSGLWNGWRIGLMSLCCGYGVELISTDAVDLEQEKF